MPGRTTWYGSDSVFLGRLRGFDKHKGRMEVRIRDRPNDMDVFVSKRVKMVKIFKLVFGDCCKMVVPLGFE